MSKLICSKCGRILKNKTGLTYHERRCDGSGKRPFELKRKLKLQPKKECDKCHRNIRIKIFEIHYKICDSRGSRKNRKKRTKEEISKSISLGVKKYFENPLNRIKLSNKLKGVSTGKASTFEKEQIRRNKIKNSILKRYENGWQSHCGRAPKITYESLMAGTVRLDGSWELKVAKYLDENKINWKRNTKRFEFINLQNTKSTYCPDFWIEDWDSYLEIKGYETDLDKCKWKQFKDNLIVWKKENLKKLNIL